MGNIALKIVVIDAVPDDQRKKFLILLDSLLKPWAIKLVETKSVEGTVISLWLPTGEEQQLTLCIGYLIARFGNKNGYDKIYPVRPTPYAK